MADEKRVDKYLYLNVFLFLLEMVDIYVTAVCNLCNFFITGFVTWVSDLDGLEVKRLIFRLRPLRASTCLSSRSDIVGTSDVRKYQSRVMLKYVVLSRTT